MIITVEKAGMAAEASDVDLARSVTAARTRPV